VREPKTKGYASPSRFIDGGSQNSLEAELQSQRNPTDGKQQAGESQLQQSKSNLVFGRVDSQQAGNSRTVSVQLKT